MASAVAKKVAEEAIGPGIGVLGQIGGALIGSRGAGKAADKQMQANREALNWEKQRYQSALNPYNRDRQRWESGQNYLLQRYGINIPGYGAYTPAQMPRTGPAGVPRPPQQPGQSLGSMLGIPPQQNRII